MQTEIISFKAKDGINLDGILYKVDGKKVLIQIHGMTSNCFKKRDKVISKKVEEIGIDTIDFNNRGSDVIRYIKTDEESFLGGMAYEDIEDSYYDIVGAIEFAINLGYKNIYLQGHSLGCTKIVYTYNKLYEEKNEILDKIKAVILLSLVDIPSIEKMELKEEFMRFAEEKEKQGKTMDMMPFESYIHPISVKTFLRYTKYYQNIDFARFDNKDDKFEVLNKINIPLFIRWGNVNEIIKQDAKDLAEFVNNKIKNTHKDINYIDGADHGYYQKEEQLADEIKNFLKSL